MLTIKIEGQELFDERTNEFITLDDQEIALEHSLVAIAKWEAIHNKPFLTDESKTDSELLSYIECMTVSKTDPLVFKMLNKSTLKLISDYISAPMTATTFSKENKPPSREIVTSEIIYYWMVTFNIPVEFENWHINRLLTLIKVCDLKNKPQEKMSNQAVLSQNAKLNAMRKKAMKTRG